MLICIEYSSIKNQFLRQQTLVLLLTEKKHSLGFENAYDSTCVHVVSCRIITLTSIPQYSMQHQGGVQHFGCASHTAFYVLHIYT